MRSNEVLGFKEVQGDCGFSLKPEPKGRPVKMDTSLKSLTKKCGCSIIGKLK